MAALEQQPLLSDGHRRDGRSYEEFRNVCEWRRAAMGRARTSRRRRRRRLPLVAHARAARHGLPPSLQS